MSEKTLCFVFGAGQPPVCPPAIAEHDLVIAADGGYTYTQQAGIRTDVLVGDFDSLCDLPNQEEDGLLIQRLSKEKDHTDLFVALQCGLERGYTRFHIYGGTGGRIDHTLANIQCLTYLVNHNARGYLYDRDAVITAIRGEVWLAARQDGIVSVFALGESADGVYVNGLKYELENRSLSYDFPLGVSNEFTGRPVHIRVERGILAIVYPVGTLECENPI